jgi:hypothetical protein
MPDERVADWEHRLDRDGLRILTARLPGALRRLVERRRNLAVLTLNALVAVAFLMAPLLGAPAAPIAEHSLSKLDDR